MAIIEGRENSLVSLLCNIRRILISALSDGDKERLIESAFMKYSQMTVQECIELVALAFSMILAENIEDKSSEGWCILKSLERSQKPLLVDVIDIAVVESLFSNSNNTPNANEIPGLVKWCLRNGLPPVLEPVVREHVVDFLQHTQCRNSLATSDLLSSLAMLLEHHPNCIPVGTSELSEMCKAVIRKLAILEMPREPSVLSRFMHNIRNVERLFKIIADHASDRRQLSGLYLKILYATVSDPVKCPHPSPALATILQVVDVEIISGSVQSILADHSSSESLIRLLSMLCGWLIKWPRAHNLNRWVLALMSKLEEENRLDVLHAVVELNIEPLFSAIVFPAIRIGVLPVVTHMLPTYCSSAEVFHKIVPRIPPLIIQLRKENTSGSRDCLQAVLDMSAQCMRVFPGYHQLYEPVLHALEVCWQDKKLSIGAGTSSSSSQWQITPLPRAARCGLHNLGNTCYMNSVLQALFMTHRFTRAVLQNDVSDRFQPVLCTLQKLFALLLHSRRPAISAEDLLNLTRPPGFSPGHQQDSSEFLIHLLDILHEQEKNLIAHTYPERGDGASEAGPSSSPDNRTSVVSAAGGEAGSTVPIEPMEQDDNDDDEEEEDEENLGAVGGAPANTNSTVVTNNSHNSERSQRERETIVRRIFGGQIRVQIQCLKCKSESTRTDPFIDLQLCFPEDHLESDSQGLTLQSMVQALLSSEKLSGDNSYRCEKCRSLQEGVRTLQVVEPPEYLILILKHFQYNPVTKQRMKLMHKVQYAETLELPVASNPPRAAEYRFYAAVVHSGRSVDAGHYYTFTRDADEVWLRMDDETISVSNSEQVSLLRPPDTPYMLFYCGTNATMQPPVGSPEQIALNDLRPGLAQFIVSDNAAYLQEENKRNKRIIQNKSAERRYRANDDDDDDENNHPGSSCGGPVAMNTPSNRFVY